MKQVYTKAILELLATGEKPSKVLDSVREVMESRGHQSLLRIVLKNVLRILESKHEDTVIFLAKESDQKASKEAIESALKKLKVETKPAVKIDETLIGGFVAEHNYKRIDKSYKHALNSLYQNITATN